MADPLGLIGGAGAAGARIPMGGANGPVDPNAPSFKDVLVDQLDQVNKAEQEATRAVEDYATGKNTSIEDVVLATQKADNAFRMLQALRNKVVEAYDEIKQTRV
ncbi:MAG: flagellar hook-basal body complex protein FliE [Phycisphaerales bacterium]